MAFLTCPFTSDEQAKKAYPLGCEVEIIIGICACADLCKNKICPFYDLTREATAIFSRAQMYNNTMTGLANPRIETIDQTIYDLFLDVFDLPKKIPGHKRKS